MSPPQNRQSVPGFFRRPGGCKEKVCRHPNGACLAARSFSAEIGSPLDAFRAAVSVFPLTPMARWIFLMQQPGCVV